MNTPSAVVVGGGLGGLSCALILKAKGYQVKVFEKNAHFGGKLNENSKAGFRFDLGPSIFTMPHIFADLFKPFKKDMGDYFDLVELEPQWRNFFEDGSRIDLYGQQSKMFKQLEEFAGPQATKEWQSYLAFSLKQLELVEDGYLGEGHDSFWQLIKHHGLFDSAFKLKWASSMSKSIAQHISNPKLQMVLEYFIKYVGSSALQAPAMMGLLFAMQVKYGLWYVQGGMSRLADGLVRLAKEEGIELTAGAEVAQILHENKKANGILLKNGTTHKADVVVSNLEFLPTYERLLGQKPKPKHVKRFKPACSGLVVHLGLDREYPELAHHNFFYSTDQHKHFKTVFQDERLPEDPTLYVVAPSRTDPGVCPKGCDNLKILPHIPPLSESINPDSYELLKEQVLDKMERMGLKGLRKHIVVEQTLTPVDIEKLYYSHRGSIYGVACDRIGNQSLKAPKKNPDIKGLFHVGGSINPGSGMPMAVLGGQQTAKIVAELRG